MFLIKDQLGLNKSRFLNVRIMRRLKRFRGFENSGGPMDQSNRENPDFQDI